jgi:hypothetical protein
MAAHFKGRSGLDESDGVLESRSGRHQRGRRESTGPGEFLDGTIDPGGKAKIIGVDDEHGGTEESESGTVCSLQVAGVSTFVHGRVLQLPERSFVDGRIQRGIVVHLQLAIGLKPPRPGKNLLPQAVKAANEFVALFLEQFEPLTVTFGVTGGGIRAADLFFRVVELEREDRKPINDQSRRFGVELGVRIGLRHGPQRFRQFPIALLHQIVSELIELVDGPLDLGDLVVRRLGGPGPVLDVPEVEIGAMLRQDRVEEFIAGGRMGFEILMPEGGGAVVERRDLLSREVDGRRHWCW